MALKRKIKLIYHAFMNTQDKKSLLKNAWKKYKQGGMTAVKASIMAKNETSSDEREELYMKQLKEEKKEYEQFPESLLFVIVSNEGKEDKGQTENKEEKVEYKEGVTYKTISDQVKPQDDVVFARSFSEACETAKNADKDYVFFIKDGDYVAPYMRDEFAVQMNKRAELTYSDEAVFNEQNGQFIRHYVKPEFSFFDELEYDVLQRAVVYRVDFLKEIDTSFANHCFEADMLALNFRAANKIKHETREVEEVREAGKSTGNCLIAHIEKILLLRRNCVSEGIENSIVGAVRTELKTIGIVGSVVKTDIGWRISNVLEASEVDIIIAAYNAESTIRCINSILQHTEFIPYNITVVGVKTVLESISNAGCTVSTIECNKEASLAERYTKAIDVTKNELVLFIREDINAVNDDWLIRLHGAINMPGVSAVSPKILRQDNTIRYAGMIAGGFGFTAIPFNGVPNVSDPNKNAPAFRNRAISVLSSSCMMVKRSAIAAVDGGKEELFKGNLFSDKFLNAQLSFDIRRTGESCVLCADAVLYSVGPDWYDSSYDKEDPDAYLNLLKHYGTELSDDPYFTNDMKYQYLYGVPIDFKIYSPGENCHE